jgi:hypothetical protein
MLLALLHFLYVDVVSPTNSPGLWHIATALLYIPNRNNGGISCRRSRSVHTGYSASFRFGCSVAP